jgi:hypothetical protein
MENIWKKCAPASLAALALFGCINEPDRDKNTLSVSAAIGLCGDYRMTVTDYPGAAYDIAASNGGTWVIGTRANGNGYRIYKWNGSGWQDYGGGAVRIDMNGATPYVVNSIGELYYLTSTWSKIGNAPSAVDVGQNDGNNLYVISKSDHKVYGYPTWTALGNQTAMAISVDGSGKPWIITQDWLVKYWNGSQWIQIDNSISPTDIGAASGGVVYASSGSNGVYRWSGSCWSQVINSSNSQPLVAQAIDAVGNKIWYVDLNNQIHSAQ